MTFDATDDVVTDLELAAYFAERAALNMEEFQPEATPELRAATWKAFGAAQRAHSSYETLWAEGLAKR